MPRRSDASSPVLAEVRHATDALHRNLESTIEVDKLLDGTVSRPRYTRLLATHLDGHRQIAANLKNIDDPGRLLGGWSQDDTIQALTNDLQALNVRSGAFATSAIRVHDPLALLGWIYVVEGACHGNCQMLATMQRDTQFVSWNADQYLQSSRKNLRSRWPQVLDMLQQVAPDAAAHVTKGAVDCFTRFGDYWRQTANSAQSQREPHRPSVA